MWRKSSGERALRGGENEPVRLTDLISIGRCSDHYWRLLRKAISSELALSSFELLNLKTPIFKGRRYE